VPGFDQIGNPVGNDAGLAAAGSGQDKQRPLRLLYGGTLLGIKLVEEIGHAEVESQESKVERKPAPIGAFLKSPFDDLFALRLEAPLYTIAAPFGPCAFEAKMVGKNQNSSHKSAKEGEVLAISFLCALCLLCVFARNVLCV
jgi:hypothetical protein